MNIGIFRGIRFNFTGISAMSTWISADERMLKAIRKIVPNLNNTKYKGQDGRIGIFGGSSDYTGAPYFAAMSALRTGADIVHIFCVKDASTPIKSFSPEPIVHPILDQYDAMKHIKPWLDRLHVIIIGPGLGRDDKILKVIVELISVCRELKKPLVIDADGLFLIFQKPDIIKDYPDLILTPNAMEFSRLAKSILKKSIQPSPIVKPADVKELADSLGKNVVILHKGAKDVIADGHEGTETISCGMAGSGRRCGGQGDLLVGCVAVFWWWAICGVTSDSIISPSIIASYAGSRLVRECNSAAYKIKQRATLTSDMLEQIQHVFARIFETHSNKNSSFNGRNRLQNIDN
ncbi:ATP-dependent (S)-NAD(P)H-hydrate dehydratase isoform X2 [Vespula pensylvanica]|uniref:ATP-dependent (S)-NAD(P)H-hydrate dehydratase isoform X2 n=1 Tax=Vespula pensylvanica TaxID=30213 RepID=UPI001CBA2BB1|nr:ATP-dependent (S)-NAD(P)H-hydrate dehydratase isoform X2 [Vespula pensylvanica]XP_050845075.1 ATP-dependent (S)-NAD(P)H-hydrate dehydratase isoform X1 [Vespula vulgaris]